MHRGLPFSQIVKNFDGLKQFSEKICNDNEWVRKMSMALWYKLRNSLLSNDLTIATMLQTSRYSAFSYN